MTFPRRVRAHHVRPRGFLSAVLGLVAVPVLVLTGCRELLPLNSQEALLLNTPERRHDIRFTERTEALMVGVVPGGSGLSANQEIDVAEFAGRYLAESTGRMRISTPVSVRDRAAAARSVAGARGVLIEQGVPPQAIELARHGGSDQERSAIRLSFERPVAVGPSCGTWPENLGTNHERVNYTDFGCSMQRNVAIMAANPRDLMGPQPELPRSSERRSVHWSEYTKSGGGGGGAPAGGAAAPADAKPASPTKK